MFYHRLLPLTLHFPLPLPLRLIIHMPSPLLARRIRRRSADQRTTKRLPPTLLVTSPSFLILLTIPMSRYRAYSRSGCSSNGAIERFVEVLIDVAVEIASQTTRRTL